MNQTEVREQTEWVMSRVKPLLHDTVVETYGIALKIIRLLAEQMRQGNTPTLSGPDALEVAAHLIERSAAQMNEPPT